MLKLFRILMTKSLHLLVNYRHLRTNIVGQLPDDDFVYQPGVNTGFNIYRANSIYGTKKISLTYDDGPHITYTPQILDLLKEYDVKATFFVLTGNINENNRFIIERIVNEGHNLASHDQDHDNNNNETRFTYKSELTRTIKKVESILDELGVHQTEMYYRFPYGQYGKSRDYHHMNVIKEVSQELYGENCISFVFWDIDSNDWVPNITPQNIADNVKASIEGGKAYTFKKVTKLSGRQVYTKTPITIKNPLGGGIVLLHDSKRKTIAGTRILLEMARKKGWEFVSLNSIKEFNYQGKTCVLK
jgi:peptidoglycan-N-acetylglucosamine deacetylase